VTSPEAAAHITSILTDEATPYRLNKIFKKDLKDKTEIARNGNL
jgi:hypothetical protein